MGKNKKKDYDKSALKNLASHICHMRKPIEEKLFPKLAIDIDGLEKAILQLERKERESLEHFWGLVPGTMDQSKRFYSKKRKANDVAYMNMFEAMTEAAKKLLSIEMLYLYDKEVKRLISQIASKINKTDVEDISDIDAVKYLIIFWVFISGGPNMFYEQQGEEIETKYDESGNFDQYALLKSTWEDSTNLLEDHSINLKLLIETIQMFDLKDVIAMKRFAGLPISRWELEMESVEPLSNFGKVRKFKQKLFQYGEWEVTVHLIYNNGVGKKVKLQRFSNQFSKLRSDWDNNVREYESGTRKIKSSMGVREVVNYNIGGLEFTDIYEVMNLYVNRNSISIC